MVEHVGVPTSVSLVYRMVGATHVFSSKGINGLVHVGSDNREDAFRGVMTALNKHVTHAYGCEATYSCAMTYEQFSDHLDRDNDIAANFLELTLDQAA